MKNPINILEHYESETKYYFGQDFVCTYLKTQLYSYVNDSMTLWTMTPFLNCTGLLSLYPVFL